MTMPTREKWIPKYKEGDKVVVRKSLEPQWDGVIIGTYGPNNNDPIEKRYIIAHENGKEFYINEWYVYPRN